MKKEVQVIYKIPILWMLTMVLLIFSNCSNQSDAKHLKAEVKYQKEKVEQLEIDKYIFDHNIKCKLRILNEIQDLINTGQYEILLKEYKSKG